MKKDDHAVISVAASAIAAPVIFLAPPLGGLLCFLGIGFGISALNTAKKRLGIIGIALCTTVLVAGRIYISTFCQESYGSLGGS